MTRDPNRRESPGEPSADGLLLPPVNRHRQPWWWRLIPTAIFGVLGCSSLSLGFVLAIALIKALVGGVRPAFPWYASLVVFLWSGVAWILASWCHLKKHRRWGTIMAAIGFVLPIGWELAGRMWPQIR